MTCDPTARPQDAAAWAEAHEAPTGVDWWRARPAGSRLVGLVVARDDMPPIIEQRAVLARFGVEIADFRHPAPETLETWEERLVRLFGTLEDGDVLVVASIHALGRTVDEETRTVATLTRRGVVVKVLEHAEDAERRPSAG